MGHYGERPFTCSKCPLAFRRKYELNKHAITHDEGLKESLLKHSCEVCGKKNYSPSDLRKHMLKHTTERTIECSLCNKKFKEKYTLKSHIISQHHYEVEAEVEIKVEA